LALRRLAQSTGGALALSSLAAAALGALLFVAVGVDPASAYRSIWTGAVGSGDALAQTSLRAAPLLVMALGLVPALRAGVFTIGSEGQFGVGALTAGLAALAVAPHMPDRLVIPVAALAGAAGGCAWALVPALLRAYLAIDEILTTLAFNFVAVYFLQWLLNGPARGKGQYLVQTSPLPEGTWLPTLFGTVANAGLVVLPLLLVGLALFGRSPAGYRTRLFGAQPSLALAAGTHPRRVVLWTMAVGGAAAGVAGWLQIAGVDRAVYASVFRGYGYLALALVILGEAKLLPTVAGAILFAALQNGSEFMQLSLGVSSDFVFVMQGVVLLLMSGRIVGRRAV
jgi:ABC-type uncharacterized transport system permease subunit